MSKLSIGKIRGLQQIANQNGIFTMCAMDHRGSLQKLICEEEGEDNCYQELVDLKLELCSILAEHASAVLLDPIYGAAQCISHSAIAKNSGLLVSIEATGYEGGKEHRLTRLLNNWNVGKIKRLGASAVKLLVYYRPDIEHLASQQRSTVKALAEECIKYDIPFLVETKSYPIGDEVNNQRQFAAKKEEIVIKTAREITSLPIDVLKIEFPADLAYQKDKSELTRLCRQLDTSSPVPWVILSGGADFEVFRQEVEIACRAGASGFLAGRAIWQEVASIDNARERVKYLATVATDRLKRLNEIANKYAVPWYRKLGLSTKGLAPISERWYAEY